MRSYLVTLTTYTIAFVVSVLACYLFSEYHQWLMILIGHTSATFIIFLASQHYGNSSLYDPFWSVAPIPIVFYLSISPESKQIDLEKILLICLPIYIWGIRLTSNWARDWKGLHDEDFRYINLKSKPFGFLIDLFGIHLYPTLQVNLSLFPIYYALSVSSNEIGIGLYLASTFTILAIAIETISDEQMRQFRRSNTHDKTMKEGLWKYSRHPNYLGEILFWWGLYFMAIAVDISYWYLFISPLVMNLMFSLVTCQMMDNRSLERRPDYADYMLQTRQLVIWKK